MREMAVLSTAEYQKLPKFEITYGVHETPFGKCVLGLHKSQICFLGLPTGNHEDVIKAHYPSAVLKEDGNAVRSTIKQIFDTFAFDNLRLIVRGTDFQAQVWKALTLIPLGETATYEHVAMMIGKPSAIRAVGNAVGANPVSIVIPCHRVVSKSGDIKYGWGARVKEALLSHESKLASSKHFLK